MLLHACVRSGSAAERGAGAGTVLRDGEDKTVTVGLRYMKWLIKTLGSSEDGLQ